MEERHKKEEILWKQKSRIQWLREVECNTLFFHKAMIQHRQCNQIFSLSDESINGLVKHFELFQGVDQFLGCNDTIQYLTSFHKNGLLTGNKIKKERLEMAKSDHGDDFIDEITKGNRFEALGIFRFGMFGN